MTNSAKTSLQVSIKLPEWMEEQTTDLSPFTTDSEKMDFVIQLSDRNIRHQTGGPFAAAVFNRKTGELIAAAVNRVTASCCCLAHAETIALALAQQKLGVYSLKDKNTPDCELFASTEPCIMCYGAVHWSGVTRLVCGALKQDAEAVGFKEGTKPKNWKAALNKDGIEVKSGFKRKQAATTLQHYAATGNTIYNP